MRSVGGPLAGNDDPRRQEMATGTAVRIPRKAREILRKQSFAHAATLMPDGSPRVTPVWVDVEGDEIVLNTTEEQMKPTDLRNDPRVAIAAIDPDNPYDAVIVRGRVSEMRHPGAHEQIDTTARKYLDEDEYPFHEPGDERVKVHIEPEHVTMPNE
jgi:PPOX class probable F420-dependent enzyme